MSLDLTIAPPEQRALIDAGFCGAPTRNGMARGPYCRQPAGKRTDHFGEGRCWLHGGRNRITHGRYSEILKTDLADAVAEQEEDPDIFDTRSEIAALRALIIDLINRYDEVSQQTADWHKSFGPGQPNPLMLGALRELLDGIRQQCNPSELAQHPQYKILNAWWEGHLRATPKPTKLVDISEVYKMLGEVTKMVERVGKLNAANAISRKDFVRIMTEIGNIIDQVSPDDATKAKFKSRMGSLRLA